MIYFSDLFVLVSHCYFMFICLDYESCFAIILPSFVFRGIFFSPEKRDVCWLSYAQVAGEERKNKIELKSVINLTRPENFREWKKVKCSAWWRFESSQILPNLNHLIWGRLCSLSHLSSMVNKVCAQAISDKCTPQGTHYQEKRLSKQRARACDNGFQLSSIWFMLPLFKCVSHIIWKEDWKNQVGDCCGLSLLAA